MAKKQTLEESMEEWGRERRGERVPFQELIVPRYKHLAQLDEQHPLLSRGVVEDEVFLFSPEYLESQPTGDRLRWLAAGYAKELADARFYEIRSGKELIEPSIIHLLVVGHGDGKQEEYFLRALEDLKPVVLACDISEEGHAYQMGLGKKRLWNAIRKKTRDPGKWRTLLEKEVGYPSQAMIAYAEREGITIVYVGSETREEAEADFDKIVQDLESAPRLSEAWQAERYNIGKNNKIARLARRIYSGESPPEELCKKKIRVNLEPLTSEEIEDMGEMLEEIALRTSGRIVLLTEVGTTVALDGKPSLYSHLLSRGFQVERSHVSDYSG